MIRRSLLTDRLRLLRGNAWRLAQVAIAAALAWFLAREALGHPQPFFAAVAAIISLGATRGQRGRQALELMLGVSVGIGVADLVIAVLGAGPWQIAFVVFGAMATTVLLGERQLMINQAAVSAALVATIDPPTGALPPDRFFDALIGSGIALVFSQILFPDDPVKTRPTDPLGARRHARGHRTGTGRRRSGGRRARPRPCSLGVRAMGRVP